MHFFTSSILCAYYIIVVVELKEITTKFLRDNALDGFMCPGTKPFFNFKNVGKASCANECSENFKCIGLFFVPATGKCIGCRSQFDPGVTEPLAGSIFYRRIYNFLYIGCYIDGLTHRILGDSSTELTDAMTTVECLYFCNIERNFTHALTEEGHECYCANNLNNAAKAVDRDCAKPCTGNPSQVCGGYQRGSVYLIEY